MLLFPVTVCHMVHQCKFSHISARCIKNHKADNCSVLYIYQYSELYCRNCINVLALNGCSYSTLEPILKHSSYDDNCLLIDPCLEWLGLLGAISCCSKMYISFFQIYFMKEICSCSYKLFVCLLCKLFHISCPS